MEQEGQGGFALSVPGAIIIAGLLIAGSIVYVQSPLTDARPALEAVTDEIKVRAAGEGDHVFGSRTAPITLIEYSDFECPFCARIHPTLADLVAESQGEIAWVYRHFPLTGIHAQAFPAARASECVAALAGNDAFWRFADALFEAQDDLGDVLFEETAAAAGVGSSALRECIAEGRFDAKIEQDAAEAVAAGGEGTPYVVVQGPKGATAFAGSLSPQAIRAVIDRVR